MGIERNTFENSGLKIEKDRVLTYSKLSCPLECTYCFVDDMDVNFNQEKGVAYMSDEQFDLLGELPDEVRLIMLGCGTEFFQNKENALEILNKLTETHKDISTVTKLTLSSEYVDELKNINEKLKEADNLFSFSLSVPCIASSEEWEPKVPSPEKRIKTLQEVYEADIKTLVAIRPLLPTVSEEELKDIILKTKDFTHGYYFGPLYLKSLKHPSIKDVSGLDIEKVEPHWMPEGNTFYKIEKKGQMDMLRSLLQQNDQMLFEGAAEAVRHLKKV